MTLDHGPERDSTRARVRITRVVLLVVVYLFLLLFAGLSAWPWLPRTAPGWAVFAVVAPPLYLAGEWAGDRLSGPWWKARRWGRR